MSRELEFHEAYRAQAAREKLRRDREERIAQHNDKMKQTKIVFWLCLFMFFVLVFISRLALYLSQGVQL